MLKRLTCLMLVILTLLSLVPTTAFASSGGTHVGGQTNKTPTIYTSDTQPLSWSSKYQGIRLSIVDKNGDNAFKVRPQLDGGEYAMSYLDIYFNSLYTETIVATGTKFNSELDHGQWLAMDDIYHYINGVLKNGFRERWNANLDYIGPLNIVRDYDKSASEKLFPTPMKMSSDDKIVANGLEVKRFLMDGVGGTMTFGSSGGGKAVIHTEEISDKIINKPSTGYLS